MTNQLLVRLARAYQTTNTPIRLSSDVYTNEYLDCRQALSDPRTLQLACRALLEALRDEGVDIEALGGMTMGADPLAVGAALLDLEREAPNTCCWFSVRKLPKEHGTGRKIEGFVRPGSRVAVLDDVITTGSSLTSSILNCRDAGMEVVLALGLVNRGALAEVAGVKVVSILDFSDVAFVGQAREFAFKAHDGQMYGSTPYSEHLEETVQVLVTTLPDCPPELLAAAYLHDVLEDTFLTTDDLHEATSGRVVGLVDACTDGKGQNRRERKERPFELIPKRPDSILVKLADRIANAERCRATGDSRLNMYRKEHSVFIARLNHAPTSPGLSPKPLWERLTNALSNSG